MVAPIDRRGLAGASSGRQAAEGASTRLKKKLAPGRASFRKTITMYESYPFPSKTQTYFVEPDLAELQAKLTAERIDVEKSLVGSIYADPRRESCRRGVELALAAGVADDWFIDDGCMLLFQAAVFAGRAEPLPLVIRLAVDVLNAYGQGWNLQDVLRVADAWPGPTLVPVFARRLADMRHRAELAEDHWQACRHLLGGPPPVIPSQRTLRINFDSCCAINAGNSGGNYLAQRSPEKYFELLKGVA
jgi:hypothetical protein